MSDPAPKRVMMISTHGYVAAKPELGRPDTGGQVVYVLEVSKALARLGHPVDIFTRQFEGQPAVENVEKDCRVVRIPCGGDAFIGKEYLCNDIPEWINNAAASIQAAGLQYDLINTHYWDAGLAGEGLAKRLGIPHVHTPHSIGAWKRDNMAGNPVENERRYNFNRRIADERSIYHDCAALVATTPQQRQILATAEYATPDEKIAVVPPGYDDARFQPVSRDERRRLKAQLGLEGRIVLALGRLARNKGYDLLIRSMAPVFKRLDDVKLLLAAGGSELSPDEEYQLSLLKKVAAELGVTDRILFRDYIPDDQLATYYQAADVFALSSRYEPFGMTAVEAMACGTPTVITTGGGLYDQVRWGVDALYADPYDPSAYGHMIYSALKYPKVWRQLSRFGARKARSTYTWTAVTRQLLEVFERAAAARSKQAATASGSTFEPLSKAGSAGGAVASPLRTSLKVHLGRNHATLAKPKAAASRIDPPDRALATDSETEVVA